MTIRSKVGAAAVTVLAPEAKVAEGAAGAAGAAGAKRAGGRKLTPGTHPDDVNAELQRRRINAKHAARNRRDAAAEANDPEEQAAKEQAAKDSGGEPAAVPPASSSVPSGAVDAAHAGGGFALGLVTYVVVLTYIKHGSKGVRQLARAKLFNKTGA